MMKALLRLAAVRDTKQAGELGGDTVHFIASSSVLVLMMQNGNIYRPLTQTATCLLRLYSSIVNLPFRIMTCRFLLAIVFRT